MRRREFIAGLGAVAWPVVARTQQRGELRRVGVLIPYGENDPDGRSWLSAFTRELARLGWTDGRNLRTEVRWAPGSIDPMRTAAKELVGLQPDVILSSSTAATTAFARETQTIPIVFAVVSDPVGDGFVASLPRPGGNITGFISMEAAMAGKWLELLTEIAPGVKRVAAMFNPEGIPAASILARRPASRAMCASETCRTLFYCADARCACGAAGVAASCLVLKVTLDQS
jgi:putative tryptophan/tyrosine transport system substrate-binding protein